MTEADSNDRRPALRWLFAMCQDLDAVREFYTDAVGLQELSFRNDEDWGWLHYDCGGVAMTFNRAEADMPAREGFAWQPGGGTGEMPEVSWGIEIPEDDFEATVERVKNTGAPCQTDAPEWRQESYWGFTVKDPAGNTVELYTTPSE